MTKEKQPAASESSGTLEPSESPAEGPAASPAESSEASFSTEAEAEALCASLETFVRAVLPEMPKAAEMAELRALQASLRDLAARAEASGEGARGQQEALQDQLRRQKEAAARARADFLNYQERAKKDLARAEEIALRDYVTDLLPVLESLDLAMADARSETADVPRLREALRLIQESFENTLKVRGLERIEALGQPFDPNVHESVASRPPKPGQKEAPNSVVEVCRPGYRWKGKVLRPAQVLITTPK